MTQPLLSGAEQLAATCRRIGVTHVVGLPDNSTAPLFNLLRDEPTPRMITVTREGEAFAIAAGLWLGGRRPLVLIQATGLLESGDALRGTLLRMRLPIVTIVTCRGYALLKKRGLDPAATGVPLEPTAKLLLDPGLDAVAVLAEPTLRTWGIPSRYVEPSNDLDQVVEAAHREAEGAGRPVALILTSGLGAGDAF
jgi:sulfopyruvate decarboxylase TPP-binding subunit